MLHEFALDPEVIADWNTLRFFADNFGFSLGRLISEFPKKSKWKKLVHEAVSRKKLGDIEKLRIVEKLNTIDSKFIQQSRPYNGENPWINNVIEQNKTNPFYAIITEKKYSAAQNVLVADDVHEGNQTWKIFPQKLIPRVANDMAQAVSSLLKIAQEIIFIDPYFYPNKRRFYRPLDCFLQEALHESHNVKRIEYHLKVEYENEAEKTTFGHNFNTNCQHWIAPLIPKDFPVNFVRWKEREGGKQFHARYILTERGGVLIENGLDDDDGDGGQVTPVILLNSEVYSEVWNDFQKVSDLTQCPYEYDNEITIVGTKT